MLPGRTFQRLTRLCQNGMIYAENCRKKYCGLKQCPDAPGPILSFIQSIISRRVIMQRKTAVEMNGHKPESTIGFKTNDGPGKSGQPVRRPAIYRSVGVRVPGNDSLMVVHVREY